MNRRFLSNGALTFFGAAAALWMIAPVGVQAQFGPPPPQAPRPAKQVAPQDLTGYWVSIVTEDWRWRMVTPAKGDYTSVPLSQAGRKAADAWDPDKDIAAGNRLAGRDIPTPCGTVSGLLLDAAAQRLQVGRSRW